MKTRKFVIHDPDPEHVGLLRYWVGDPARVQRTDEGRAVAVYVPPQHVDDFLTLLDVLGCYQVGERRRRP